MLMCKAATPARKRYERDVMIQMVLYVAVVMIATEMVRHRGASHYAAYFWAILAAMPILGVLFRMARYLQEETDEYQKMLVVQSLLLGTAALLGTLVITDFLRAFAKLDALPPFLGFIIFCAGMALMQLVQKFRNRVRDDD